MEALWHSECVLMKRRHISAGQTSVKYDILFFCISKMACLCAWGRKHGNRSVLKWDSCLKIQNEIKQGRKKTMEENRWADEESDGSHSKCVSCRLNICMTLVSVVPEILLKYKNNLVFFSSRGLKWSVTITYKCDLKGYIRRFKFRSLKAALRERFSIWWNELPTGKGLFPALRRSPEAENSKIPSGTFPAILLSPHSFHFFPPWLQSYCYRWCPLSVKNFPLSAFFPTLLDPLTSLSSRGLWT